MKNPNRTARDTKYGLVMTEHGNFLDGEPVVVIRARDACSVSTLSYYAMLCVMQGSRPEHVSLITQTLVNFTDWQRRNSKDVRVPQSFGFRTRMLPPAPDCKQEVGQGSIRGAIQGDQKRDY